ncbi:Uncharacterized protein PODLI_1B023850, partial [Podarcis lilfordi]
SSDVCQKSNIAGFFCFKLDLFKRALQINIGMSMPGVNLASSYGFPAHSRDTLEGCLMFPDHIHCSQWVGTTLSIHYTESLTHEKLADFRRVTVSTRDPSNNPLHVLALYPVPHRTQAFSKQFESTSGPVDGILPLCHKKAAEIAQDSPPPPISALVPGMALSNNTITGYALQSFPILNSRILNPVQSPRPEAIQGFPPSNTWCRAPLWRFIMGSFSTLQFYDSMISGFKGR